VLAREVVVENSAVLMARRFTARCQRALRPK
jgi:hypothetical protein